MITGFEKQTHELNQGELDLVPLIAKGLRTKIGHDKAITNARMVRSLSEKGHKITCPRLRKIINYIRNNNIVYNLVASSKGYYIAENETECRRFIESLDQRASAIITVRDAMAYQLAKTIKHIKK